MTLEAAVCYAEFEVTFDADEEREEQVYVVPLVWDVEGSLVRGITVAEAGQNRYKRIGSFSGSDSSNAKWLRGLEVREIVVV